MAKKYYAYFIIDSSEEGIVNDWPECQNKVRGKKARYKSFKNLSEAETWLSNGAEYDTTEKKENMEEMIRSLDKNAVYFDAGTGRGNGVEVRVTDYHGNPLIGDVIGYDKVNDYGNYYVAKNRTNNFGELVGLFAALKYAMQNNIKIICGDSNLVIEYWSKGRYSQNIDTDTINLIKKVKELRMNFESKGGTIKHVSGDVNPADLGFHK